MKPNLRTSLGTQTFSFVVHAIMIALLFTTATYIITEVPEVPVTYFGEQTYARTKSTLSGMPSEKIADKAPPTGADKAKDDETEPAVKIPEQMLQTPDKPVRSEESKEPRDGLPGEPSPATEPTDGIYGPLKNGKPGLDSDGIPALFGEPIQGKTVFLLDISGSMSLDYNGISRLNIMLIELANYLSIMYDTDEFDVVAFSGDYDVEDNHCKWLWGELKFATLENKQEAIDWIKLLYTFGSTPTSDALRHVSEHYPNDLDNLFLITDGYPNEITSDITDAMPVWYKDFAKCRIVCVSIGGEGVIFLRELVHVMGGVLVIVK